MSQQLSSTESAAGALSDSMSKNEFTAASETVLDDASATNQHPASQSDDESFYVKDQSIIRNGMDVSKFLVSVRDDDDPALTFRCIFPGTVFGVLTGLIQSMHFFKPDTVHFPGTLFMFLILAVGEA